MKGCRQGCQVQAWWAGPAQATRVSGVQAEVLQLWGDGGLREASRGPVRVPGQGRRQWVGQRCGTPGAHGPQKPCGAVRLALAP